jgi:O-antigen/teichoic acid export membrane protein
LSTSVSGVPAGLSLRANFSWTFVGNVIYAGCQWGMLVVLAKLGSPEMVGQFALGLAITVPIMAFATLKTRLVQATDAKGEYRFGDYFGLRLATTVAALLVIVGIVLVSGYHQETAWVILILGIAKAFESISDVFYGLLQQHERMDRVSKSKMIRGPLSLVALSLGLYLTGSIVWGVAGMAAAWALVLVGYDIRSGALMLRQVSEQSSLTSGTIDQKEAVRPRWEVRTLIGLAWLALPLGIVVTLDSLRTSIPRYFLERHLGEAELGIFAAMAYLRQVGNIVAVALGLAACPRMAKYYAARNGSAYRRLVVRLVGINALLGAIGVLVAVVAGRELLTLLYRPEYAGHQDVFVMLIVAAGIDYIGTALDYGMTAARYFRVQMPLFAAVTGTTTLVCLWQIPSAGLRGAALAVLSATIVYVGGSLAIVLHALRALRRRQTEDEPFDGLSTSQV